MYLHPLATPPKFVPPPVGTDRPPGALSGDLFHVSTWLAKSTRNRFRFIGPSVAPAQVHAESGCFFAFTLQFFPNSIALSLDNGEHFHFPNTDDGLLDALRTASWAEDRSLPVSMAVLS